MNKQLKKVELCVIKHATLENNRAYLLRTEITKSHLNNHVCQHCGMKTSTVTLSFYYVFNIFLPCNISIPSFNGNLWWVLLLGNHLDFERKFCPVKSLVYFLSRCLPGLHNSVTRKTGRKKDIAMFFLDVSFVALKFSALISPTSIK